MKSHGNPLEWWIERYERKTGERFNAPEGFQLAFDPNHGFFLFMLDYRDGHYFINIGHTCVDSWSWVVEVLTPFARAAGAKYIATATNRNEKAYARLTGAIRKPEYDYDNYKVFVKEVV